MTDRQILDALAMLPRDAFASRDRLCDLWFSPTRPKPVKDYRFGDFNFN